MECFLQKILDEFFGHVSGGIHEANYGLLLIIRQEFSAKTLEEFSDT